MKTKTQARLIVVEGIDGSGKTALVKALAQQATQSGRTVVTTKEPGGSELGKQIRPILQQQATPLDAKAEFLLFAADRAQHIRDIVKPALAQGSLVISDRMSDSSVVYQGYGRGEDMSMIQAVNGWVMGDVVPDVTIYVRVPVEIALERIEQRNNKKTAFETTLLQTKAMEGFDALYVNRTNVIIIDGTKTASEVAEQAWHEVQAWL